VDIYSLFHAFAFVLCIKIKIYLLTYLRPPMHICVASAKNQKSSPVIHVLLAPFWVPWPGPSRGKYGGKLSQAPRRLGAPPTLKNIK